MKKSLLILTVLLLLTAVLCGCGKVDESAVLGRWDAAGLLDLTAEEIAECGVTYVWEFTQDGRLIQTYSVLGMNDCDLLTYSVKGKRISIAGGEGEWKVENDVLTITGGSSDMVLTRIP